MKILVYGVTNWDGKEEFDDGCMHCNRGFNLIEWYNRVVTFIPNAHKVFITTGTYSDPRLNPLPVDIYQLPFIKVVPYSPQNSYFRVGFMTGIWKALLDYTDFDILFHVQCRTLLGKDLTPYLEEFMNREEQVMGLRYTSGTHHQGFTHGIDVGAMAMKRDAALMYAIGGRRFSCDNNPLPMNCETEAYLMFKDSWMKLFPEIPTVRQDDGTYHEGMNKEDPDSVPRSLYHISDIEYFKKLPIIANGKHVNKEFYLEWLKANPYE